MNSNIFKQQQMKYFLSCDWGTGSLPAATGRSRRSPYNGRRKRSGNGIATTYQLWQQTSQLREDFYAAIIDQQIDVLAERTGIPLQEVPVMLSGASIFQHWHGRAVLQGVAFHVSVNRSGGACFQSFHHYFRACSEHDVMRGEETQNSRLRRMVTGYIAEQYC